MLEARCHFPAVTLGNRIYCLGGQGNKLQQEDDEGDQYLSSVEVYDAETNTWAYKGKLASAKRNCAAAAMDDDKILICGGSGTDSPLLASAELYDTTTGISTLLPPMACPRVGCTAVCVDQKVYVFGGMGHTDTRVTGEVFDVTSKEWSSLPAMELGLRSTSSSGWEVAAVAVATNTGQQHICVFGAPFAGLFNLDNNSWTVLPATARQLSVTPQAVVALGHQIYALEKTTTRPHVYDLKTRQDWTPLSNPVLSSARQRGGCAALARIDQTLYVLGGFDDDPPDILDDGCALALVESLTIPQEWIEGQPLAAAASPPDNNSTTTTTTSSSSSKNDHNSTVNKSKPSSGTCLYCGTPNAKKSCAACQQVKYFYCDRECQRKGWKVHKQVCQQNANSKK